MRIVKKIGAAQNASESPEECPCFLTQNTYFSGRISGIKTKL
jgi:hypothetical protein